MCVEVLSLAEVLNELSKLRPFVINDVTEPKMMMMIIIAMMVVVVIMIVMITHNGEEQ